MSTFENGFLFVVQLFSQNIQALVCWNPQKLRSRKLLTFVRQAGIVRWLSEHVPRANEVNVHRSDLFPPESQTRMIEDRLEQPRTERMSIRVV